jgi:integrase
MKRANARRGKTPDESTRASKRSDIPLPPTPANKPSTKLTHDIVKNAQAPATGSVTLWDGEDTGFGIRIFAATARYPQGFRSFFLNYRMNGRERRIKIGSYPDWSVSAARDEAKELRKRVNRGEDPAADKTERREAPTVEDLVQRYIDDHLPTLAAREHTDQRRMLAEITEHLGKHRPVAEIHYGDIEAMHRRITESGRPVRANRILAVCSKSFSLALRPREKEDKPWRNAVDGNPCTGVARNQEEGKERFLSSAELAAVGDALLEADAVHPTPANCVRLVMLTGCRPDEAMRARWPGFDAEPGFWVKPSAHVKQRKVHKAPLSAGALQLIDDLRVARAKSARKGSPASEWVFPGEVPGEPIKQLWAVWHFCRDGASVKLWAASQDDRVAGVVTDLQAAFGRAPTVAECQAEAKRRDVVLPTALLDARLYDLRHSFASIGAGGGLSLPIIGRLLGHTQQRTTQRYAHLADDPLREAADKIGAVIAGAGKGGAKVVSIKDGRGS